MAWVFFSILLFLALVESGLAFMRDYLMEEEAKTDAFLRGEDGTAIAENSFLWITTAAQMGMGFVLPFALMFVAIPLETFVHSLRTVLGMIGVAFLRALAWTLRLFGNISRFAGAAIVNIYDLLIFGPLFIERMVKGKPDKSKEHKPKSVQYRGAA
jgi:hypothetical protein